MTLQRDIIRFRCDASYVIIFDDDGKSHGGEPRNERSR